MIRIAGHGVAILALTLLTQLGGIAWVIALFFRHRLIAFMLAYAALWTLAYTTSPRVALPCFGEPLRMQSPLYCALNRHYVAPALAAVAKDAATQMAQTYPRTVTLALDGSFPFLTGMPLIPHLSHDDGEKLDFAFFYTTPDGTALPGRTRSPLGYFAFEDVPPETCPTDTLTLRWRLSWLQTLWPDRPLDAPRTAALITAFTADPRVAKIFVEPPLAARLGLSHPKIRFQGCRVARHDDHIHIQL
jgi:hypothetical protein